MSILATRPATIKPRRPRPITRPRPRPTSDWPSWTDEDRWTVVEPSPEPDPLAVVVDQADEAYHLGFRLGLDGEYPAPPIGFDADASRAFYLGRLAGFADSPAGREWQADMKAWRDHPARLNSMTDQDVYPAGCPG